jgi:SNF2 family DNA or RNA helicase
VAIANIRFGGPTLNERRLGSERNDAPPLEVRKAGSRFLLKGETYPLREIIRNCGWRWDGSQKTWWTGSREVVERLAEEGLIEIHPGLFFESKPKAEMLRVPEGKAYLRYQEEGIRFLIEKDRSILADEMGLGKTIQAIGVANNWDCATILVVCPASLRLAWKDALAQWWMKYDEKLVGIDDSNAPVCITSYEMATRCEEALRSRPWDLVIFDECHYLKNPKSKRTKALLGKRCANPIPGRKLIFISGTPLSNRPIDLWPLVSCCEPEGLGSNWHDYVTRYCAAVRTRFGWDVSGASNTKELSERLRAFMIRRNKTQVLRDLPPVTRQVIPLASEDLIEMAKRCEEEVMRKIRESGGTDREVFLNRIMMTDYSRVRKEVGLAKVPALAGLIGEWAEDGEAMVVMCHHIEVAEALREAVGGKVIHGGMTMEERHEAVEDFQRGNGQIVIATMASCGIGLTMTRASRMIFAELDWVPAVVRQSEARIHRIGQRHPVHYLYVVVPETIEYRLARALATKEWVVNQVLGEVQVGFLSSIFTDVLRKQQDRQDGLFA